MLRDASLHVMGLCALLVVASCGNKKRQQQPHEGPEDDNPAAASADTPATSPGKSGEVPAKSADASAAAPVEVGAELMDAVWRTWNGKTSLELRVLVTGEHAASSTAAGKLVIAKAVDDQGRAVTEDGGPANNNLRTRLKLRNRAYPGTNEGGVELELSFLDLAADAKTLSIEGQVMLRVPAKTETVILASPLALAGKPVSDPRLDDAGIAIEITSPDPAHVRIRQASGLLGALENATLVDAKGAPVPTEKTTDIATELPVFDVAHADGAPLASYNLALTVNHELAPLLGRFSLQKLALPARAP